MSAPLKVFSLKVRKVGTSLALTVPAEAVRRGIISEEGDIYVLVVMDKRGERLILATQDEETLFRAIWDWEGIYHISQNRISKDSHNYHFISVSKALEKAGWGEVEEVVTELFDKFIIYRKKK